MTNFRAPLLILAFSLGVFPLVLPCDCPDKLAPVCASNRKVFKNFCEFNCSRSFYPGVVIVDRSFCAHCKIPRAEEPVCGSNGILYKNTWHLQCDQMAFPEYRLELKDLRYCALCNCPRFFVEQVCGSNGVLYRNRCDFECFKRAYNNLEVHEEAITYCLSDAKP